MDPLCDEHQNGLGEEQALHHSLAFCQELPDHSPALNTQPIKRGRPKGLKTNRNKLGKEDRKGENKNTGHWLRQQKKKYHWFLEIYSKHFLMKQMRRMDKIFKTMADFIETREAEQCRSHHQKMQKKFHSFHKILKNLREEFYVSADSFHVKAQLEKHQIFDYDPLIPEDALENQHAEEKADLDEVEEVEADGEMGAKKNDHNFFMGDHYQVNLHHMI